MRLLALAAAAFAATAAAGETGVHWHAQVDNDVAFHTDRWYTSGVRIHRSAPVDAGTPFANLLLAPAARPYRLDVGFVHEVYTGDGRADPAGPDRPNAGRLLLSVARHDLAPDTLATWEIGAGVNGPAALGRQVQDLIHRIAPAPRTDWSSQSANRLDLQLAGAWSHRIGLGAVPGSLVLHGGAVAGTITTFGHAGLEWRSDSPAQSPNALLRFAATPPLPRTTEGFVFFAGASLRAVGRNRLFERRTGDLRDEAAFERRVSRVSAGLAWHGPWGEASLALARDSREFEGQHSPHRFGSLTLSFPVD